MAHTAEVNGRASVGFLQCKIIRDVVVGIVSSNVMVGFSRHQGVEIAMPVFVSFYVGRKRHYYAVTVSDLHLHSFVCRKNLFFAFIGQNVQRIFIRISVGRNGYMDHRISTDINNTVRGRSSVYGNGNCIILQQRLCSDLNTLDGIKHFIVIFHYRGNKPFCCCLVYYGVLSFILSGIFCTDNCDCL